MHSDNLRASLVGDPARRRRVDRGVVLGIVVGLVIGLGLAVWAVWAIYVAPVQAAPDDATGDAAQAGTTGQPSASG